MKIDVWGISGEEVPNIPQVLVVTVNGAGRRRIDVAL